LQSPPGPQIFDLVPGDYEATLAFVYPFAACSGLKILFTADECPPDCPSLAVATPTVSGCAPSNPVVTFEATLSWLSTQTAVPVSDYLWTVDWLDTSVSPAVPRKAQNSSPGPTLAPLLKTSDPGWYGASVAGGKLNLGAGGYTVTAQAQISGVSPTKTCNAEGTVLFQVPHCPITVTPPCPTIQLTATSSGCVDPATGTGATLTFVATVADPAGMSTGIDWNFGDPASGASNTLTTPPGLPTVSHLYSSVGTFLVTAKVKHTAPCLPGNGSDSDAISAMVPICDCPPGQTRNASGVCVTVGGGGGGGGLPSCAALLWWAIAFMLAGALISVAACVLGNILPQAGSIIGIIGAIGVTLFVLGGILFLIWWVICRLLTACAVILAVRAFVMVLIGVFAFIAVVIAIVAIFTPIFWPCAAAASVYGFAWGGVLAMLDWIAQDRGCLIVNPSGGAPAASSLSGLTSPGVSTRLRVSDFTQRKAEALTGLGDVIKRVTSTIGIQPCTSCHERAERLNARFPLRTAPTSERGV
jgi:hypothetical protein